MLPNLPELNIDPIPGTGYSLDDTFDKIAFLLVFALAISLPRFRENLSIRECRPIDFFIKFNLKFQFDVNLLYVSIWEDEFCDL